LEASVFYVLNFETLKLRGLNQGDSPQSNFTMVKIFMNGLCPP